MRKIFRKKGKEFRNRRNSTNKLVFNSWQSEDMLEMRRLFEKKIAEFRNRKDFTKELRFGFVFELNNRLVSFEIESPLFEPHKFVMRYYFYYLAYEEFCIVEGTKKDIDKCLRDKNLAQKLVDIVVNCDYGITKYDTKVVIPEGTVYIDELIVNSNNLRWRTEQPEGECTFSLEEYSHIGTLHIPSSVKVAEYNRFSCFASEELMAAICSDPTKFKRIRIDNIENHSPYLAVKDGVLYSADMKQLIYCFEEKSQFILPKSVTKICPYAFCGQRKLKKVTLHEGLEEIGCYAFMDCRLLSKIRIPNRIKEIKFNTFDNCLSLEKITLPGNITRLGVDAFRHCEKLWSIELPDTIEEMCSFECCYSLREITIPPKVKRVDGFMFCHSLRRVNFPMEVEKIADDAFRHCEYLKHL